MTSPPRLAAAVFLLALLSAPPAGATVTLSGEVRCTGCDEGVTVALFGPAGPAGGWLVESAELPEPGPFELVVPAGSGELTLWAWPTAEEPAQPVPCADNPLVVGEADLDGLELDLDPVPVVRLSGEVRCDGCDGPLLVEAFGAGGAGEGALLDEVLLVLPGAFALHVPAGAGDVFLYARHAADGADARTACAENPVVVGGQDVEGLVLELFAPAPGDTVRLSGEVRCGDCAGGAVVALFGPAGPAGGWLVARADLGAPGPFELRVPEGLGEATLWAWREGEAPADAVPCAGNPLQVEAGDLAGLLVDLSRPGTVQLSGEVRCDGCAGPVTVEAFGPGGAEAGPWLAEVRLAEPGAFALTVPAAAGDVSLYAWLEEDGPEGRTPYAGNPVAVAGQDVAGLDLELAGGPPPDAVRVSGSVLCSDCPAGVAVALFGPDGPGGGWLVAQAELAAPGPFALVVPRGLGAVTLWAWPAGGDLAAAVPWPGNPLEVGDQDVPGLVVDLDPPGSVRLSGRVDCSGCPGPLVVEAFGPGGAAAGPLLAEVWLARPGFFELHVPAGAGDVHLYARRGGDDPAARTPYARNPVAVADQDVAGLVVTLAVQPPPDAVRVAGTVSCQRCLLGVVAALYGPGGPDGGWLVADTGPVFPGPFEIGVPAGLGEVTLWAWPADEDPPRPVPCPDNPLVVAGEDLHGLTIDLDPPATVRLSGRVDCDGCDGPVTVEAFGPGGAEAGPWLGEADLDGPGPFALEVPAGAGDVSVYAWRWDEGPGGRTPWAGNPVAVGGQDVGGLVLDVSPPPPADAVRVAGTVRCDGCPGGVVAALFGPEGPAGGWLLAEAVLDAPGPFALHVPAGLGELTLWGWRADEDPPRPVPHAGNPVHVGQDDLAGLEIDLDSPPAVTLSGRVDCDGCEGPVTVEAFGPGGAEDGPLLAETWLPRPGPFALEVPAGAGQSFLYARREADGPGDRTPYAGNPVAVAGEDVAGLVIALQAEPPPGSVRLSGTVRCDGCAGGVTVALYGPDGLEGGWLVAQAELDAPGPWTLEVPGGLGEASLLAWRAEAGPDGAVPFAGNPLEVADADLAGLDLDLSPAPLVTLSGRIECAGCDGLIVVEAEGPGEGAPLLDVAHRIGPGGFSLAVPEGAGEVSLYAYRPEDGAEARTPFPDNPVAVADEDVAGLVVTLPGAAVPEQVTVSGTVTCADCDGGVVVALFGLGGPAEGWLVAEEVLDAAGPFSLAVPPELGELTLWAWRAGVEGAGAFPYAHNPLEVGERDLAGLVVEIGGEEPEPAVAVWGTLVCADCEGGAGVLLLAEPAPGEAEALAELALPGPGDFVLEAPSGQGEVWLYGFRDTEGAGTPDPGTDHVPCEDNPLLVGEEPLRGVAVVLPGFAGLDAGVPDAGLDAGPDAGPDVGADAAPDGGGPEEDAGTQAPDGHDAGTWIEAGVPEEDPELTGVEDDGSCECTLSHRRAAPSWPLVALLLGLLGRRLRPGRRNGRTTRSDLGRNP